MSTRANGARFGPAAPVTALNDAAANDIQPNVRADGLEVVFSSNRTGSQAQDIWVSSRARATDEWSAPTNLGAPVNTAAAETRPSLSKDGSQLLFGRAPGPGRGSRRHLPLKPVSGREPGGAGGVLISSGAS